MPLTNSPLCNPCLAAALLALSHRTPAWFSRCQVLWLIISRRRRRRRFPHRHPLRRLEANASVERLDNLGLKTPRHSRNRRRLRCSTWSRLEELGEEEAEYGGKEEDRLHAVQVRIVGTNLQDGGAEEDDEDYRLAEHRQRVAVGAIVRRVRGEDSKREEGDEHAEGALLEAVEWYWDGSAREGARRRISNSASCVLDRG